MPRENGAGMTYLCDHSAGSGKTSTISTAHDLVKLRDGDSVFNSVIIVTDRNVLDGQLQDAVKQIDHQFGVIAAIDRQYRSGVQEQATLGGLVVRHADCGGHDPDLPLREEAIITDKALKGKTLL